MGHDAGFACLCVTEHYPRPAELHLHHIVPLYAGGGENPENEVWLCLHPDSRVLMADGRRRRIGTLKPGDLTLGYDGQPAEVASVTCSWFEGSLVVVGDLAVTPSHAVLTPRGWCSAQDLGRQPTVLSQPFSESVEPHVLGLVRAQPQIQRSIIERVFVDVVHNLRGCHGSSEYLLHDVAVLDELSALVSVPDDDHAMTALINPPSALAFQWSGDAIERSQPTRIRTEQLLPSLTSSSAGIPQPEVAAAFLAGLEFPGPAAAYGGALLRTGLIGSLRHGRWDTVRRSAHLAVSLDHAEFPPNHAWWNTVDHVGTFDYYGWVYDITVPRCSAYFADGVLVHNCPTSHVNVHELIRAWERAGGEPSWEERRRFGPYIRDLARRGWEERPAKQ